MQRKYVFAPWPLSSAVGQSLLSVLNLKCHNSISLDEILVGYTNNTNITAVQYKTINTLSNPLSITNGYPFITLMGPSTLSFPPIRLPVDDCMYIRIQLKGSLIRSTLGGYLQFTIMEYYYDQYRSSHWTSSESMASRHRHRGEEGY